jgi:hypothetical protein
MSAASMTFGRPARFDLSSFFGRLHGAATALFSLPGRIDAWLERREQANMTADDVLAFARSIESSDPGFAADLRGAAMRASELN